MQTRTEIKQSKVSIVGAREVHTNVLGLHVHVDDSEVVDVRKGSERLDYHHHSLSLGILVKSHESNKIHAHERKRYAENPLVVHVEVLRA
jgi:hypothetical protein